MCMILCLCINIRILCYTLDTCSTGQMRLVGGNTSHEGRLEICLKDWGSWGTICNNQWSLTHTKVACRYFGFGEEGEMHHIVLSIVIECVHYVT